MAKPFSLLSLPLGLVTAAFVQTAHAADLPRLPSPTPAQVETARTTPRQFSALGPHAWTMALLPKQSRPITDYQAITLDAAPAVQVTADRSYGALMTNLDASQQPRSLRWEWRLEAITRPTSLTERAGDDNPVKICVAFDWPASAVPFWERQALGIAKAVTGEPLPGATLCYTWGNKETKGMPIDSPYTRRVRVIALRNATDAKNQWFQESRNIEQDLRMAFGDELPANKPMPQATIVFISADMDNTDGQSRGYFRNFSLRPAPATRP